MLKTFISIVCLLDEESSKNQLFLPETSDIDGKLCKCVVKELVATVCLERWSSYIVKMKRNSKVVT